LYPIFGFSKFQKFISLHTNSSIPPTIFFTLNPKKVCTYLAELNGFQWILRFNFKINLRKIYFYNNFFTIIQKKKKVNLKTLSSKQPFTLTLWRFEIIFSRVWQVKWMSHTPVFSQINNSFRENRSWKFGQNIFSPTKYF